MVADAHDAGTREQRHVGACQRDALVEVLRRIERNIWQQFGSRESLQEDHRRAAARAMPKRIFAGRGTQFACNAGKMGQQLTAKRYAGSTEAIGEKSEMANAHEGPGQNNNVLGPVRSLGERPPSLGYEAALVADE